MIKDMIDKGKKTECNSIFPYHKKSFPLPFTYSQYPFSLSLPNIYFLLSFLLSFYLPFPFSSSFLARSFFVWVPSCFFSYYIFTLMFCVWKVTDSFCGPIPFLFVLYYLILSLFFCETYL